MDAECFPGASLEAAPLNSGAVLDVALQEEAMAENQPTECENVVGVAAVVLMSPNSGAALDAVHHQEEAMAENQGPAGRTTESDTIIVSTPVVEKGKRKYRISPHPLKGTKQFDNNVKNHYTEILK